jgi:rSAM/selenodomain-associated transferase 2
MAQVNGVHGPWLSVIVPTLNEAEQISLQLRCLRAQLPSAELVVADGGSSDATVTVAQALADRVIVVSPGRALQMNAGAAVARGQHLLFLHVDCRLPDETALREELIADVSWGFFPARLSGRQPVLRLVEWLMTVRSRVTSVATGDQGLLIARSVFMRSGGFAALPLMEDVEFCKRLRRLHKPVCFAIPLTISSRRWEQNGIVRTIVLMWWLRFAYVVGVSPQRLHRWYYG